MGILTLVKNLKSHIKHALSNTVMFDVIYYVVRYLCPSSYEELLPLSSGYILVNLTVFREVTKSVPLHMYRKQILRFPHL